MLSIITLLSLLALVTVSSQSDTEFTIYVMNCMNDLKLDNAHAYVGSYITEPPSIIDSMTAISYSMKFNALNGSATFGSILDTNANYYYTDQEEALRSILPALWHLYMFGKS